MPKAKAQDPAEEQAQDMGEEEEDITLDMTTAKTFEPLPTDRPYLVAVSTWKTGKSAAGKLKLHYEMSVVQPEKFANRKVITDLNLEEEYSLGRLQGMLSKGFGFPEDQVKGKDFKLPKAEDMLGLQATLFVRTQTDPAGVYSDKSVVNRWALASAYKAPATPGAV